ncbi:MAG: DNA repair protein RecO, partial [Planctomycetota bacterium]
LTHWHLSRIFPILRHSIAANWTAWYLADLVHHMLRDHEPAPIAFDGLVRALEQLEARQAPGRCLLEYQWLLLGETGYRPQLDRDAETGRSLPEDASTLAFSARAGGAVLDTGGPDRWRMRSETLTLLRALASGRLGEVDEETVERANRLLAAYFREILGADLPTRRLRFPEL